MRIFTNKNIKTLFIGMFLFLFCNTILSQVILWRFHGNCPLALFILSLFMGCGILLLCLCYFHKQHKIMETAVAEIDDYLIGDTDAGKRSRFSKDTQGIGLGLPLSKTIVELHGGNIKVDSVLGKGSAFIYKYFRNYKIVINLFVLEESITELSV